MYESFYGLTEHPFSLTPDPDFLFLNENFGKSLDQITYAANRREPFAVLIGDVGTGKTTLCWALLMRMPKNVRTALILNPLLNIDDLLRAIIQDFKVKPRNRRPPWRTQLRVDTEGLQDASWLEKLTRKQLIDELNRFLLEGAQEDLSSILVIDEAQNLSPECLEQLRVLSNLETSKRKLLQIIFVGQLELDQKLDLPQLRQLKQRVTVRCTLQPLSKNDMERYIYHRLWRAGSNRTLSFSKGALRTIYKHSLGYPRLINIICDRALMAGYNNRSRSITQKMVQTALGQLGMGKTKITFRSLSYPLRLMGTAVVGLMILAGIAYFIRTWSFIVGSADYQEETIKPSADSTIRAIPEDTVISLSGRTDTESPDIIPEVQPEADPQPQAPMVSSVTARNGQAFWLQVHSLQTEWKADQAVAELRRSGYSTHQRFITNPDGASWFVVYIGPFADMKMAQEAADTIQRQEQITAILRSFSSSGTE